MALELLWSSKYYCGPELRMICVKGIEDYKMHQCRKAKKNKKSSGKNSFGAVQRSAEQHAVVVVPLFLC